MNWTFVSYLSESIFETGKNFIEFFALTTSNIALKGKTSASRERRRRWFLMGHSTSQQNPAPYSHSLAGSPEWGSELDFLRSGTPVGIVFSNPGTTVFQEELQEG